MNARHQREERRRAIISLWIKLPFTLFVCILVPVYWFEYGPQNFLWGSDIALFLTLVALWRESALIASMMAVAVLLPELAWTIDYGSRLILGPDAVAIPGTQYMFDSKIPVLVRSLSLFHLFLPATLLWLVHRLGYQQRALLYQTFLAWLILPLTYMLTDPSANINWVYGFGREPQSILPPYLYLLLLMLVIPVAIYWPTHRLLKALFRVDAQRRK